jgi:hypothetical protein
VEYVLLRKWGDGLSVGYLAKTLASLLKLNDYNHAPLYVSTWGPIYGSAPVWCVQVMLYEKKLSSESVWFHILITLHPRLPLMLEFKMPLIKP